MDLVFFSFLFFCRLENSLKFRGDNVDLSKTIEKKIIMGRRPLVLRRASKRSKRSSRPRSSSSSTSPAASPPTSPSSPSSPRASPPPSPPPSPAQPRKRARHSSSSSSPPSPPLQSTAPSSPVSSTIQTRIQELATNLPPIDRPEFKPIIELRFGRSLTKAEQRAKQRAMKKNITFSDPRAKEPLQPIRTFSYQQTGQYSNGIIVEWHPTWETRDSLAQATQAKISAIYCRSTGKQLNPEDFLYHIVWVGTHKLSKQFLQKELDDAQQDE